MIIMSHGDSDGICAAALVKMVPRFKNQISQVFFSHPTGFSHDLAKVDEDLVITDIALDRKHFPYTKKHLERISQSHYVLYIDHHELIGELPPNVELVHSVDACATELTHRYFAKELPVFSDRIAAIGAIGDYMDNTEYMMEILHRFERRALFLDAGLLAQGLYSYRHDYSKKRRLVDSFARGDSPVDIKNLREAAIRYTIKEKAQRTRIVKDKEEMKHLAYIIDPSASKSKAAHWVMGNSGKKIGIAIIHHRYKRDKVDLTIRGKRLFDLREIIPALAQKYKGTGGGHANACGARIPKIQLEHFLKDLDQAIAKY